MNNNKFFINKTQLLLALSSSFFITACPFHDDPEIIIGSGSTAPEKDILAPIALNHSQSMLLSDAATSKISLKEVTSDPQGYLLTLESVTPLTQNCPTPTINAQELSYQINPLSANVCFYRYKVSNQSPSNLGKSSSGYSFIQIANNNNELKDPLSLPHLSVNTPKFTAIIIDMAHALKDHNIDLNKYSLEPDTAVLGGGSVDTDSATKSIIFTPDDTTPVSRLLYKLKANDDGAVLGGSIDVITTKENTPQPTARFCKIDNLALMGEKITAIDLTTCVSDPNGSKLTLVDVSASNAQITLPKAESEICTTCFDFQSNKKGKNTLIYTIKNEQGGFASANATINVKKPWQTIIADKTYTDTPDKQEAIALSIPFSTTVNYARKPENTPIEVPIFSQQNAQDYCQSKGLRLPLVAELLALYQQKNQSLFLSDNWPVSNPYWASSAGEAVSLANGEVVSSQQEAFVSCVEPEIVDIKVSPETITLWKDETKLPSFSAKIVFDTGASKDVTSGLTWESRNKNVATINEAGQITPVTGGTSSIDVTYDNVSSVIPATVRVIEVQDIQINPTSLTLVPNVEYSQKFQAKIIYNLENNLENTTPISWRSDAPNIASITPEGILSTHSVGVANIYAYLKENEQSQQPSKISVFSLISDVLGSQGQASNLVLSRVNPILTIQYNNERIFGVYSESGEVLLAGGYAKNEAYETKQINLNQIRKILLFSNMYDNNGTSVPIISKIIWTDSTGASYELGSRAQGQTKLATLSPEEGINRIKFFWSEARIGRGFITGVQISHK